MMKRTEEEMDAIWAASPLGGDWRTAANRPVGRVRDGRICTCGHSVGRHAALNAERMEDLAEMEHGAVMCATGKFPCACREFVPILVASDARRFLAQTTGPFEEHALFKGVQKCAEAGVDIQWVDGIVCGRCRTESDSYLPVPIAMRPDGPVIISESGEWNFLLCAKCRTEVPRVDSQGLALVEAPKFTLGD